MSISQRLQTLLKKKNISISKFSELSGIPYRTLQNYLGGLRSPTAENLMILCTRLSVNCNWLLTGQGDMFLDTSRQAPPSIVPELPPQEASNDLPHEEIIKYFKDKELARLINWNLIKLESIKPEALKKISEYVKLEIKMEGGTPDEGQLSAKDQRRNLKNGTTG